MIIEGEGGDKKDETLPADLLFDSYKLAAKHIEGMLNQYHVEEPKNPS